MNDHARPAWAVRLKAERERQGWNKHEMARRLHAAGGTQYPPLASLVRQVRRWENGERFPRDWTSAYAVAYDMTPEELFGEEISTGAPYESVEIPLLVALPGLNGRPIDAGYVQLIREANQTFVKLDTLHGGKDVFPLALRVFRIAHGKLATGAYAPEVERDLAAATGETGEIAAWLAYDADQQAASRQVIHEALMLSRQAGDRDMELFELAHLAMQSIELRRPAEGLRIASDALDQGRLSPRVAALFEIRRGRALAQMGDATGAFDALDKARSALMEGIGPRDPNWTWWVADAMAVGQRGWIHADLGDWGASVELFQDAVGRRATSYRRQCYNDLVNLLNALVHVRDWRAAEPVLSEVASQVGEVESMRITNLLQGVVNRLGRTETPSTIADTAEQLRRFLGEEPTGEPRAGLV